MPTTWWPSPHRPAGDKAVSIGLFRFLQVLVPSSPMAKKFPTPVDRHIGMRVRMQRRALDTTQHTLAGNRDRNSTGAKIRERRQSRQRWSAPADRARFAHNTGILFRRGTGGQQTPRKRRPASRRLFLRQRASPFHKPWAKSVTARRAAL